MDTSFVCPLFESVMKIKNQVFSEIFHIKNQVLYSRDLLLVFVLNPKSILLIFRNGCSNAKVQGIDANKAIVISAAAE